MFLTDLEASLTALRMASSILFSEEDITSITFTIGKTKVFYNETILLSK